MTEFYDQIICETNPDFSIIIEDDGRVLVVSGYRRNRKGFSLYKR
jgi:hypothetical protein